MPEVEISLAAEVPPLEKYAAKPVNVPRPGLLGPTTDSFHGKEADLKAFGGISGRLKQLLRGYERVEASLRAFVPGLDESAYAPLVENFERILQHYNVPIDDDHSLIRVLQREIGNIFLGEVGEKPDRTLEQVASEYIDNVQPEYREQDVVRIDWPEGLNRLLKACLSAGLGRFVEGDLSMAMKLLLLARSYESPLNTAFFPNNSSWENILRNVERANEHVFRINPEEALKNIQISMDLLEGQKDEAGAKAVLLLGIKKQGIFERCISLAKTSRDGRLLNKMWNFIRSHYKELDSGYVDQLEKLLKESR